MSLKLLIDNWLLQDIAQLLQRGLSNETAGHLAIDYENDTHYFEDVPFAGVQLETLLSLLAEIVIRDKLILDEQFAYVWARKLSESLAQLENEGTLKVQHFDLSSPTYEHVMELALKDLCVTTSLKKAQSMNEKTWREHRYSKEQYLSQILWGTAGNFGRSHMVEAPYSPHPFREHFIENAMFKPNRPDAVKGTFDWINNERIRIFQEVREGTSFRAAQFVLSPITIEIVESAKSVEDLIPVALQMRKQYAKLREQMRKYQKAIDDESPEALLRHKKLFDSVSASLSSYDSVKDKYGQLNVSVGTSWFVNWTKSLSVDSILGKFGVQAILKKLILTPKGETTLKKLLKMFDEGNTKLSYEVQEYFRKSSAK
ncbi:hypothetical protein ACFLVH_03795 [Chloroflexota bacterium]